MTTAPDVHAHFAPAVKGEQSSNTMTVEDAQMITTGLIKALELRRVTPTMLKELMMAVRAHTEYFKHAEAGPKEKFDEKFSLSEEMGEMIASIRALRKTVFCPLTGGLVEGQKLSDARDIMTTSNQMMTMMVKTQEKILNIERFRAVEQATIDVLKVLQDDYEDWVDAMRKHKESGEAGEGPILDIFFRHMQDMMETPNE